MLAYDLQLELGLLALYVMIRRYMRVSTAMIFLVQKLLKTNPRLPKHATG